MSLARLLIAGIVLSYLPSLSSAADVILEWNAPTARSDGSPLTTADIAAYRLYCASKSGGPYALVGSVAGNVTQATVQSCAATGAVFFVSTAVDRAGLESPYSNEATVVLVSGAPQAPVVACPVQPKIHIVSPVTGQTSRPLYSDAFTSIGRVEFIMPDSTPRVCESSAVQKPGTSTYYRYATNNGGVRGLTICKEWKP